MSQLDAASVLHRRPQLCSSTTAAGHDGLPHTPTASHATGGSGWPLGTLNPTQGWLRDGRFCQPKTTGLFAHNCLAAMDRHDRGWLLLASTSARGLRASDTSSTHTAPRAPLEGCSVHQALAALMCAALGIGVSESVARPCGRATKAPLQRE